MSAEAWPQPDAFGGIVSFPDPAFNSLFLGTRLLGGEMWRASDNGFTRQ